MDSWIYLLEFVFAAAVVILGLAGLFVRPAWAGGALFLAAGTGVAILTDMILLGIPPDFSGETLLDETFFVAWLVLFILLRLWVRYTPRWDGLAFRAQDLWNRIEFLLASMPGSERDVDGIFVEERQFNYSLKAAGEWAEKRKRREAELAARLGGSGDS